jgi:hypothetical protein
MTTYKVTITKYIKERVFNVEAKTEEEAKLLAFKEYEKQPVNHSFNVREE